MKNYSANNYYLLDKVLYMLLLFIISCIAVISNPSLIIFTGALVAALLSFGILAYLVVNLKKVTFDHHQISVTQIIGGKQNYIHYYSIKELEHLFIYPVFSRQTVIYLDNLGKARKLKTKAVVALEGYMDFIKYMRTKNSNIKFSFLPSDSKLKETYLKEYNE
ncbi:MAG: hypothetical protein N4A71_27000 [Carboxylicivirga sp.]|nr:hypothetical protein [Carboxylicivirga sp.]